MKMQSFQSKALDKIEAMATAKGLECSKSEAWANTGTVHLHLPGEITPIGSIGYDFQSDTYTLKLTIRGRQIPSQPGRADYFAFYQRHATPSNFWLAYERELQAVAPRKGRKAA